MSIPLNEFEDYVNSTILGRGQTYYSNGYVSEPELISKGVYEFIIVGTYEYTIHIHVNKGTVTSYDCNCPYDMGSMCKHVAAALYYLKEEIYEIDLDAAGNLHPSPKEKSVEEQVQELLDNTSHSELKKFIKEQSVQNRDFRNLFLMHFGHTIMDESKERYEKQLKKITDACTDSFGFIHWSEASTFRLLVSNLTDEAKKHLENKNYQSAFYICTAVADHMATIINDADDSDGDIGYCFQEAFEILIQLAQQADDEHIRKQMADYCFSSVKNKIYDGWDWHTDILALAAEVVKTDEEADHLIALLDGLNDSEYIIETAQRLKYDVLLKCKGEAVANTFLHKHINNPNLRRIAIANAMADNKHEDAAKFAKAGIKYDSKNKPGLAKEWYDWLLKIAQKQNDTVNIIKYARYLFVDGFRHEQDYYHILKTNVDTAQWKPFVEDVVRDIEGKRSWSSFSVVANIYIKEQWWDRLFEMVKKNPQLQTLEYYAEHLVTDYKDEIMEMYANGILNYLDQNVSRKHYITVCGYLKRMKELGGTEKANAVIAQLRKLYPKRPALMEELGRV